MKDKREKYLQWEKDGVRRKERKLIEHKRKEKESLINKKLDEKIPEKLQVTIENAFEKTFGLIFEKGTPIIEKTYDQNRIRSRYRVHEYSDDILGDRESIRAFSKEASRSVGKNLVLSGLSGVGMGFFGMGITDIPVFTGMLLKSIYEISLHYGFEYNSEEERYFILLLIEGAMSNGEHFLAVDEKVEGYIKNPHVPWEYSRHLQISDTSRALTKGLMYAKFLQGIPVVGVVGGSFDAIVMKQVTDYAKIKYKKRFLSLR